MKMDGSVIEEISSLRCWDILYLLNWIGSYIISIAKSVSERIVALTGSIIFPSIEVALYLYKIYHTVMVLVAATWNC